MLAATKPLLDLTAHDLMSTAVVTISEDMSLRAAARLLYQSSISGAPVVDKEGRCLGVLSATDFVSWAGKDETTAKAGPASPCCVYSSWQVVDAEALPTDEVRGYMTADPVTVMPLTPVGELARMMVDAHIHRVIVVDGQDRPVGIVSSTDILAAVGYAAGKLCSWKG
ncbi:MAG TPA: CBS domain-containing protein [Gemmataceae bacterium]|jgi:CBS domain-containing protein|nr:CBS domain-containing protein [Gemmataceae bacterium]